MSRRVTNSVTDPALTESEQRDLADVARRYLTTLAAEGRTPVWPDVVDMGWTSLGVPENLGGAGYGQRARRVIAEAAGETLLGGSLWPTIGLALPLAVATGDRTVVESVVSGAQATVAWCGRPTARFSRAIAAPPLHLDGRNVSGRAVAVPMAYEAEIVIAPASDGGVPGIWSLSHDHVEVTNVPNDYVDRTCPVATLKLHGEGAELARGPAAVAAWEHAAQSSALWLAAESLGIAQHLLNHAVDYARERTQFGRKIGSYQAVSHPLADLYADIELARSAVDWAAEALDLTDDAEAAVLTASALTQQAAVRAAEQAIQVFGGLGMTWESPIHQYFKRALAIGAFDGGPHILRERLAVMMFRKEEASR